MAAMFDQFVTGTSRHIGKRKGFRLALLSSAALAIPALNSGALAQEVTISDDVTTPINTSTADGGNPADVIIDVDGSVTVDSGTAVTVDSDNDLTVDGAVVVNGSDDATADGSVGVLLTPGFSGNYTQSGTITLDQTEAMADFDDANELPPDYNDNRTGILLDAGGTFTGDIFLDTPANVNVFGDMSAGVRILGNLAGGMQLDGNFDIDGENSQAVNISGNVSGDVIFGDAANINVDGVGSTGILVDGSADGSIDGAFVFGGIMQVRAYTDTVPDPEDDEDNDNDIQEARQSGAAIDISGDIGGGILINGPVPPGQLPEAEEGEEAPVNPVISSILVQGSSPAISISGGASIGLVDTSDLADPAAYGMFGFINRGAVNTQSIYPGVDTNTVLISNATIAGGLRNDGTFRSVGNSGSATTVIIENGSNVPTFFNGGLIETVTLGTTDPGTDPIAATSILIRDTSSVGSFFNQGVINTIITSDNGSAFGLVDESGSVTDVRNSGGIVVRVLDDVSDGNETNDPTGQAVAMDFSANTSGVTITNTVSDDFGPGDNRAEFGIVVGDVLLGSGDDFYIADAGRTSGNLFLGAGDDTVDLSISTSIMGNIDFDEGDDTLLASDSMIIGDLAFGAGTDSFNMSDNAMFNGVITDSDGALDISLASGSILNFGNATDLGTTTLNISSLIVDATSTLGVAIADMGTGTTQLGVSGTALLEAGATINPIFLGAVPNGSLTSTIISAGTLTADVSTLAIGDSNGNSPFLFDFDLSRSGNDLILSAERKSAADLGIAPSLEAAIDPTIAALNTDLDLGVLIFNLTTQEDFQSAFGQLVAGPLDAPLAYARAQTNSVTSIITQRLDMARNSGEYGRTFWLQEETYFINRDEDAASNGFDGGGFALAAGVDAGFGDVIDAVGLSVSFSSARYDEQTGEDFPFNRVTYGVGAYGAATIGDFKVDARGEFAVSESDSERNVAIGNVRRQAIGEWEGSQVSASGRISYESEVNGFTIEPFASLDFVSIEEDAYTETSGGTGVNLSVSDREADSLRANLGIKAGKVYEIQPSLYDTGIPGTLHPQLTLAWSQETIDDPIEATYTYAVGGESFTLTSDPEDGAGIIGADIAYENEYAKVHIGASGTFGDQTETYVLRAGVGLKW